MKATTLKFNKRHDKTGRFAAAIGGALRSGASKVGAGAKRAGGHLGELYRRGATRTGRSVSASVGLHRAGARAVGRGLNALIPGGAKRTARTVRGIAKHVGSLEVRGAKRVGRTARFLGKPAGKLYVSGAKRVGRNIKRGARVARGTYNFLYSHGATKETHLPADLMTFKDAETGEYKWVLLSSNGFRDRDGEIVSTKALENDVAQWELDGRPESPLRYWHVNLDDNYERGLEMGMCDFRMVYGHTLIEAGRFISPTVGEAVFKAQSKLGASIGFHHSPLEPDEDLTYNRISQFERSLLPTYAASNSLSDLFSVKV